MTEHNQKLQPSAFEPGTAAHGADTTRAGAQQQPERQAPPPQQTRLLAALVGLALVAAGVFFWLPAAVTPPEPTTTIKTPTGSGSTATTNRPAAQEQASPWSDAQLQKQRKEAQAILEQLLAQQFTLEEMSVEQWAAEEYQAALELAASGDELYRQQQFEEAQQTYQQGLAAMTALVTKAPEVFASQLQRGLDALAANQAAEAGTALSLALLIQPDSSIAQAAQVRARNLPAVLELLEQAEAAAREAALEAALALTEEALALDPLHELAKAQRNDLQDKIARRDFNRAMTAGYQAMDKADYDAAEARFLEARKLLPAAAETGAALTQARTARTLQRIDSYRTRATRAESAEDWGTALEAYEAILRTDATVQFAREGAQRSRDRKNLHEALQQTLDNPGRLADQQVYAQSAKLQAYAATVSPAGPIFRQQLAQLDKLMREAIMPIPVLLKSDEQTEVTVYRVARLGTFSRQQLELKPGTYTAVGVRNGFRDVRREFTLSHDQPAPVITIACTEPI